MFFDCSGFELEIYLFKSYKTLMCLEIKKYSK